MKNGSKQVARVRLSEVLLWAKNHELAEAIRGGSADIEINSELASRTTARELEMRAYSLALAAGAISEKGYGAGDVHSNKFLPNFSIGYRGEDRFIADLVAPIVPVDKASDKYVVWDKGTAYNLTDDEVSPTGTPAEIEQKFSSATYNVTDRALTSKVPNDILARADQPLELMDEAAVDVQTRSMRGREKRVADLVMTAANYGSLTNALAGTARWDVGPATSTADPVGDILGAMDNVGLGVRPNALVMSQKVFTALRKHPKVLASISGVVIGKIASSDQLRDLFEVEYLLVGNAKYNSAGAAAAASMAYMWGAGCALLHVNAGAKRNDKAFAKTFRHMQWQFETWNDPKPGARGVTWVKGAFSDAEEIVMADGGYLLDTVIS